jgi:hypothetical protein
MPIDRRSRHVPKKLITELNIVTSKATKSMHAASDELLLLFFLAAELLENVSIRCVNTGTVFHLIAAKSVSQAALPAQQFQLAIG